MLLYGEGPKVPIGSRQVALHEKDIMKKRPENRDRAVIHEADEHGEENEGIKRGIDFQRSSDSETRKSNRAILAVFGKKQAGDQESTQDKE